ncbi:MAG TPA: hypothetical protein VIW73_08815 [Candidatus Cybelea sp.]
MNATSQLPGKEIESADRDSEARAALWRGICVAAEEVRRNFSIRSLRGFAGELRSGSVLPPVPTWQLVEAISLLSLILRSDSASANAVNVFGKTGPIEIQEDGKKRFLWAQQPMRGESSTLGGKPDLVVTLSDDLPQPQNTVRVIEAKCVRVLDTQTIRAEFGKAHDLRVATYFIWTFYSPSTRLVAGARGLGLDLVALGFDTARRDDLITNTDALISHVSNSLLESRRAGRFAQALQDAGHEASVKLSGG